MSGGGVPFCSVLFNVNFICFCQSEWSLVIVPLLIQDSCLFCSDLLCIVLSKVVIGKPEGRHIKDAESACSKMIH